MSLKLAKKHPMDSFRIGTIVVKGYTYAEYELSQAEIKELNTAGPKVWISVEKKTFKKEE